MPDRVSTRALAIGAVALGVIVLAFFVIVSRSTPGDRLARSIDHAVARADSLESDIDALSARVPSTTAPPVTFRETTTTSSPRVDLPVPTTAPPPPPSIVLTPATQEQLRAVITSGAWDFQLPLPAEGLASASFTPAKYGGTLTYTVPAPAADTATFFRTQLAAKRFVFTEQRGGEQYTFLLGGQGQILVGPAGVKTTTLTVTLSL